MMAGKILLKIDFHGCWGCSVNVGVHFFPGVKFGEKKTTTWWPYRTFVLFK